MLLTPDRSVRLGRTASPSRPRRINDIDDYTLDKIRNFSAGCSAWKFSGAARLRSAYMLWLAIILNRGGVSNERMSDIFAVYVRSVSPSRSTRARNDRHRDAFSVRSPGGWGRLG